LKVVISRTLDEAAVGVSARVDAVALEPELSAWLAAVGIAKGETVVVLRRAAFGGPIHVRIGSGGEFAVARTLAHAITIDVEGVSTEKSA
jgi:ferrous iron transport protein A